MHQCMQVQYQFYGEIFLAKMIRKHNVLNQSTLINNLFAGQINMQILVKYVFCYYNILKKNVRIP